MIKSEREYKVTAKAILEFEEAIALHAGEAGQGPGAQAAAASLRAQLADLRAEAAAYEALKSGGVREFKVERLEDLPRVLIQARIALGMTQKDLAQRLSSGLQKPLTQQQVQRWEEDDYQQVSFWRLIEVAEALGISVSATGLLARPTAPDVDFVADRLKGAGVDRDFVSERLVPRSSPDDDEHGRREVFAARVEAVWGVPVSDILVANDNAALWGRGAAVARFKVAAKAKEPTVVAFAGYARFLLRSVCDAFPDPGAGAPPSDPAAMRTRLFGGAVPTLAAGLDGAWNMGIPVLPLSGRGGFHGACWREGGRGMVALKQSTKSHARWLFDLVHELQHLAEGWDKDAFEAVDADGSSDERRLSEEEKRAHAFAAAVLLGPAADRLYGDVIRQAQGRTSWMKRVVREVAESEGVGVGLLANHVAFRFQAEGNGNWWGVANGLQAKAELPYAVARNAFAARVDLRAVAEPARGMLVQALDLNQHA
jgi:transcriptional regulator with XRE-family HTH domain